MMNRREFLTGSKGTTTLASLPMEENPAHDYNVLDRTGRDAIRRHPIVLQGSNGTRPGVAAGVFLIPCSSPANGEISIGCGGAVAPVG